MNQRIYPVRPIVYLLPFTVIVLSCFAYGQGTDLFDLPKLKIETGDSKELKGITKIFLFPKMSDERTGEMVSLLNKSGLPLQFVSKPDDAEIILSFAITATQSLSKLPELGGIRSSGYNYVRYRGRGIVFKRISSTNIRMLIDFDQRKIDRYFSDPWKMFIKDFIEKYKTANPDRKSK